MIAAAVLLLLHPASGKTTAFGVAPLGSKSTGRGGENHLFASGGASDAGAEGPGPADIDHQLYSRQLFVYGLTAQRKLMNSNILVCGSGPLAAEVVKNLAMAGVGTMTIIGGDGTGGAGATARGIKGEDKDLSEYASALNPNLHVQCIAGMHSIDDLSSEANSAELQRFDLCIICDHNLADMERINAICRKNLVKMVGCCSLSVTGLVFNDFLEGFSAESAAGNEGDDARSVALLSCSADASAAGAAIAVTLTTIEEESVLTLLTAGDRVRIADNTRANNGAAREYKVPTLP